MVRPVPAEPPVQLPPIPLRRANPPGHNQNHRRERIRLPKPHCRLSRRSRPPTQSRGERRRRPRNQCGRLHLGPPPQGGQQRERGPQKTVEQRNDIQRRQRILRLRPIPGTLATTTRVLSLPLSSRRGKSFRPRLSFSIIFFSFATF